ncbi:hypothetical protein EON79_06755 [bacterium]|nr:MAG: hypothetical protein EON79_06755 [bacterium]
MSQQISLVMASSSLRADDLVKTLGKGDLSEAEAGKKGFLRKEDFGVWIFLDRGLIEDETIARIEKVVDMWRERRIPQRVPWKDLTAEEKRAFGGVLAHGFSGRIPGMLEGRLASSDKWFAYRVDAEIGRGGKDMLTLSIEKTQDQPSVRPPSTAPLRCSRRRPSCRWVARWVQACTSTWWTSMPRWPTARPAAR